ncbi:glycerol kinase [Billgrantia tianxiuensis]|jgi:glycerol kinase|uniref:Glycerol kinase n=1 Tax=Billgrantia tianxiuensis TaxID=2497861 RepID=A0A6I6SNA0_9GAMM|nr:MULTISPECIES: glycerol kinase GlpK [Halomonas]MCE8035677.1 glycerol kinase GlpK [Halomonas sp. MCCC 1A11057]QHC50721.1 glycerol kinase [Halomonas tianxiuensis]
MSYLLSIDQGTTSSRAVLFDRSLRPLVMAQRALAQSFPGDGWVEHDAEAIWQSVLGVCREALQPVAPAEVAAIGITNQRESTVVWDRATGEPIHPVIVWQDRRTVAQCEALAAAGHGEVVRDRTGLLIDPYFSATKLAWILDNVPGARQRAERGELAFGTVDSYLIWRLTGGRRHLTDATNASRTLLFNIHTQQWDAELLALFDIPAALLPAVCDSSDDYGVTDSTLFGHEIPILGVAGDQHAALVGQACFETGMLKSTYGTGCFMMLNTGERAVASHNRLLTTLAYRLNGVPTYAMEGSIFVAGATVQWLRDGLGLFEDAAETEWLAERTRGSHGVYLVPAFTGLGAPHWDPRARGAILGLTRDTGIAELVAAGLRSVCFQSRDLYQCMMQDVGTDRGRLRVDGGMVANGWLMQCLADVLGQEVDRPVVRETTAQGAAYLAALGVGWYRSLDELAALWQCERTFMPAMSAGMRESLYAGWQMAVARVKSDRGDDQANASHDAMSLAG